MLGSKKFKPIASAPAVLASIACWGLVNPQILIWNGSDDDLDNVSFLLAAFDLLGGWRTAGGFAFRLRYADARCIPLVASRCRSVFVEGPLTARVSVWRSVF